MFPPAALMVRNRCTGLARHNMATCGLDSNHKAKHEEKKEKTEKDGKKVEYIIVVNIHVTCNTFGI